MISFVSRIKKLLLIIIFTFINFFSSLFKESINHYHYEFFIFIISTGMRQKKTETETEKDGRKALKLNEREIARG